MKADDFDKLTELASEVQGLRVHLDGAKQDKVNQGQRLARLIRLIAFSCRDALRTGNKIDFVFTGLFVDAETGVWLREDMENCRPGHPVYVDVGDVDAAKQGVQRLASCLQSILLKQLRGGTLDRAAQIEAEANRMRAVATLLEGVDHA